MDEAAIRRFIDALEVPDAFAGPESTIARQAARLLAAAAHSVPEWRVAALEALTVQVLRDPVQPLAAVLLQDQRTCRTLEQSSCEELGWFVARARRAAMTLQRPLVAVMAPDATAAGVPFARREPWATAWPVPVARLVYYVETRTPPSASAAEGVVELGARQARIGAPRATLPGSAGVLARVLRGHPARRRHRLPRRAGPAGA